MIAACIFYLPANLLPITHTTSLGHVQSDTIMSGVLYFISHGDWPLALLFLVLYPLVWLLLLPLRLVGIAIGGVLELFKAIIFLPARLLGQRPGR